MDYSYFYKRSFNINEVTPEVNYDLFLSAFDDCDRTKNIYNWVTATEKKWLLFPQYHYDGDIGGDFFKSEAIDEDQFILDLFENGIGINSEMKLCIDCTGFLIPHLVFLMGYLDNIGVKSFDMIYTEPERYEDGENTRFSEIVDPPKTIPGFSSRISTIKNNREILIVTAGYHEELLIKTMNDKKHVHHKYCITGFPSLQPDMYQENILRIKSIKETIGERMEYLHSPAYDPFLAAQMFNDIVNKVYQSSLTNTDLNNIYIAPISTKPQAIGAALFYLWNKDTLPINIIYPCSQNHILGHAIGVKRTWCYTIELP